MPLRHRFPLAVSALVLAVTGCGTGTDGDAQGDASLTVVTSFYPLQEAAERVGGSPGDEVVVGLALAAGDGARNPTTHRALADRHARSRGQRDLQIDLCCLDTRQNCLYSQLQ